MFTKLLRAATLVGFVVAAATTGLAQDKLSGGDKKWMEKEVGPIITEQEISMFQQIDKDDRKLFKELFWMRRDYTPTTPDNEFRENYESRMKAADDSFKQRGIKGSESDMGRIFLLLGPPSQQVRGRAADVSLPSAAGEAGVSGADPANPDSAGTGGEPFDPNFGTGGGGRPASQTVTWVYDPRPDLGIPDGLKVEFRQQSQFGYRIANMDDIEEALENVKQRFIANPGINYARDEKGRLREADDRFDPNSPAKLALRALRETGETSSAIAFDVNPSFFRSSEGQIYIPLDISISEGLAKDEVTVFGSVENADGFEIYQFEEPAKIQKDKSGHMSYEMPLQLGPGLYTLYLGLIDGETQTHGTQIVDLEVPDYDDGELTLSSILMFAEAEQTGDAMGQPGKAFLLGGYHFIPKREMVYENSEQLAGVFNVYNFGVQGDKPNLTLQVRFFKDGQSRGQTREEPFMLQTEDMALTIFDIPLSIPNFQDPGMYKVELHITDKVKNEKLKEEIEFEIKGE